MGAVGKGLATAGKAIGSGLGEVNWASRRGFVKLPGLGLVDDAGKFNGVHFIGPSPIKNYDPRLANSAYTRLLNGTNKALATGLYDEGGNLYRHIEWKWQDGGKNIPGHYHNFGTPEDWSTRGRPINPKNGRIIDLPPGIIPIGDFTVPRHLRGY